MKHETLLSRVLTNPAGGEALARAVSGSGLAPNFSGHWVNELHSSMDLTISGASVSGKYTSAVSGEGGPVCGDIIGYVASDVIAFSVLWPGPVPSITSWVGQLVMKNGEDVLDTLRHLVVSVPDAEDPNSIWTTIHAGAAPLKAEPSRE